MSKNEELKPFLEALIDVAGKNLRSISWHSDGRVIAKSGASAKNPRKLYTGSTPQKAILKLIEDNDNA